MAKEVSAFPPFSFAFVSLFVLLFGRVGRTVWGRKFNEGNVVQGNKGTRATFNKGEV
jgi:hypothetical protein